MRPSFLSPRRWWVGCAVLVGFGLVVSGYLLARVFVSLDASSPNTRDLCSVLFSVGCDETLADDRFWILNVPVAGWGLVYFTTLAGLLFLARFMKLAFETEALRAATVLNLAGIVAGFALLVWAWVARAPVCPLCLSVHAINLLLLGTLRKSGTRLRLLRSGTSWLMGSETETPEPTRWKLVGFATTALLAALVYQWVYLESALRRGPPMRAPDRAEVIAAYRTLPHHLLPVTNEDPHLGPLTAPVRLVVFESFRCSNCRRFSSTLSRLRRSFRDRLLVVYKHYPLSTLCNDRLTDDQQPGACEMAWASEAARRQSRFWPFHDALLDAQTDSPLEAIELTVRRLKLDPARFAADQVSEAAKVRVAEDVALGDRLKIPGTPAVFLEGRLVRPHRADVLEILIRYELDRRVAESRRNLDAIDTGRPKGGDRHSLGG